MIREYSFSGKVKWLMRRPNEWGKYTLQFYGDKDTMKAVKATGIKNAVKVDDSGEMYYTFRSNTDPFLVQDVTGSPVTALIGNGSDVTVSLGVETFVSPAHGKSARSEVISVTIDKLIEYTPEPRAETEARVVLPS